MAISVERRFLVARAQGSTLDATVRGIEPMEVLAILIPIVVAIFFVAYYGAKFVAVLLDIYNKWPRKPKPPEGGDSLNPGA